MKSLLYLFLEENEEAEDISAVGRPNSECQSARRGRETIKNIKINLFNDACDVSMSRVTFISWLIYIRNSVVYFSVCEATDLKKKIIAFMFWRPIQTLYSYDKKQGP